MKLTFAASACIAFINLPVSKAEDGFNAVVESVLAAQDESIYDDQKKTLGDITDPMKQIISDFMNNDEEAKNFETASYLKTNTPPQIRCKGKGENRVCSKMQGRSFNMNNSLLMLLKNYGCWCNFEGKFPGQGNPVDQLDAVCKGIAEAYDCAKSDITGCRPWKTSYELPQDAWAMKETQQILDGCNRANKKGTECQRTTCIIQVQFITDLLRKVVREKMLTPEFFHDAGFEPTNEAFCPIGDFDGHVDKQCCGTFPKRRTYNANSSKQCCNNSQIFDSASHLCCEDGVPRMVCDFM